MRVWRPGVWFYAVGAIVVLNVVYCAVMGVVHGSWQTMWMSLAMVVPVMLVAMLFDWARHGPRHVEGTCRVCGYDLKGLPAGSACPECGRPQVEPLDGRVR